MRTFRPRTFLATLLLGATWLSAAPADAQQTQNVDVPRFNPSFAGDRFFGVPSPYAASDGTFNMHGGLLLDYAHNPLVVASADDSPLSCGEPECSIVEHQLFLHLNATVALFDYFAVNVDLPIAVYQAGEGDVGNSALSFTSPDGAALGDLRLGARVRVFGEYHDPLQIGIGGYVSVPIGTEDAYVSDGSVRGQPQLLVGGRVDRFIYSVMAGPTLRGVTNVGNVTNSHQFNWGAGAGVLLLDDRNLQLGVETTGGVSLEDTSLRNTNAEAQAGVKYRFVEFMEVGAGVGPGFTNGLGTPDVRALFSIQYTPEPKAEKDRDGDGILDAVDACPEVKGVPSDDPTKHGCPAPNDRDGDTIIDDVDACPDVKGVASADPKKHGCPPAAPSDQDKDGILDAVDACIDVPGVESQDPAKNGCPADKDGDGVYDKDDACVDVPGIKTADPKTNGCPGDTDGDGITDDKDACPKEKGTPNLDPKKHGCPKAILRDSEIVILEQVQFDTARATIKPVSDPLLDAVARIMKEHPQVLRLEVQGHTDRRGARAMNNALSESRAKAVQKALEKRGIEAKRLTAKGYGPDKPLDTADNEAAWEKNRRVQFVVLEMAPSTTSVKTK